MERTDKKPSKFFWIDVELTGLVVAEDRITEVGVIITDHALNEIATYSSSISHDQEETRKRLVSDDFWGQRPDQVEQILHDMKDGKPEFTVEDDLIGLIEKHYDKDEAVYLAGNSVRVDRGFIDQWMPRFAARLHYRMLDVTALKLWWLASGKKEFIAPKEHRAVDDIRRSISELKFYNRDIR